MRSGMGFACKASPNSAPATANHSPDSRLTDMAMAARKAVLKKGTVKVAPA